MLKILALDCAIETTGYAIVHMDNEHLIELYRFGVIQAPALKAVGRTAYLARGQYTADKVAALLSTYGHAIDMVCAERTFVGRNGQTTVNLATVRGIILAQVIHSGFNPSDGMLMETEPAEVKKMIAGKGNAKKPDVANAVLERVKITPEDRNALKKINKGFDVTDAIAIALTCGLLCLKGDYDATHTPAKMD